MLLKTHESQAFAPGLKVNVIQKSYRKYILTNKRIHICVFIFFIMCVCVCIPYSIVTGRKM